MGRWCCTSWDAGPSRRLPSQACPRPSPPLEETALVDAVEVYHRTYTTILRSSGETQLRVFEHSHKAMGSSLHPLAGSMELDLGALLYAVRRLPDAIFRARLVVMGQSAEVFAQRGFRPFSEWTEVSAPGRRRRWYDDGDGTLAVLIASASDVDDLIPTMVALQIELNKLRVALDRLGDRTHRGRDPRGARDCLRRPRGRLAAAVRDLGRGIRRPAGGDRGARHGAARPHARRHPGRLRARDPTLVAAGDRADALRSRLLDRPVYFVSSNSHAIANLLTGVAPRHADELAAAVDRDGGGELRDELQRFRDGTAQGHWNNFLYYAARERLRLLPDSERAALRREEREAGSLSVTSRTALDVAAQVIPLDRVNPERCDERVLPIDAVALAASRAVIVNIDYPLGLAAYNILREVAETVDLRGVYILGKAATLNADVGDVMISSVIHDEHSRSTYWLDNAFSVSDIAPYLRFGSGLDNQRAVSVKGTFLQNRGYLDFYYREAFTVVEMEAGPYCDAVYEMTQPVRYPTGEPVNFSKLPIDFGVIHYASDTPYTQARTLGARGLSYFGMDSTYASSVAIVRRIVAREGATGQ